MPMKLPPEASGRPLFLLGSGRCGSTYWQTLLCHSADTWIWGEHGGLLRPVLLSRDLLVDVAGLLELGRTAVSEARLTAALGRDDGPRLAWSNRVTPEDYDDLLRGFIDAYMRHGLPAGRSRWGFKEIRYGGTTDETPRRLLALFPGGHVVHTLRHPRQTLDSWMRIRHRDLLSGPGPDSRAVLAAYDEQATIWQQQTDYLLDLAAALPGRVVAVRLEQVDAGRDALERLVGSALPPDHPRVNGGPRWGDAATDSMLEEAWSAWQPRLAETARRAGYA